MDLPIRACIEPLEARIAPASLVGKVLTYTDTDGDLVTIKFTTKATLTTANFVFDTATFADPGAQVLQRIVLNAADPLLDGTALVMTVTTPANSGGNGRADVGAIDATGHDLGSVTLKGDLGRILAGNADDKPGLGKLSAYSLGVRGTTTQPAGGSITSIIFGAVGSVALTDDFDQARFSIKAANANLVAANLGSLIIGGDVLGGAAATSGEIETRDGAIKSVTIGGDLRAGTAQFTGYIYGAKGVGAVTIKGNFVGGGVHPSGAIVGTGDMTNFTVLGDDSGFLEVLGKLGKVEIGGNLTGLNQVNTGYIGAAGDIGSVHIGGIFSGEAASLSGVIYTAESMGKLTIDGDVLGGAVQVGGSLGSAKLGRDLIGKSLANSGSIRVGGTLGSITIGRDITGGSGTSTGRVAVDGNLGSATVLGKVTGTLGDSGQLVVGGVLKLAKIGGDLQGGTGDRSGYVRGGDGIGAVTINGSVLGAGGSQSGAVESSGAVGTVKILGNLRGGTAEYSGYLGAGPALKSLSIGGELVGGTVDYSGTLGVEGRLGTLKIGKGANGRSVTGGGGQYAGTILAGSLGTATLEGDLVGGTAVYTGDFLLGAGDGSTGGAKTPVLKSLTIKGSVLGGSATDTGSIFADGPIASVTVLQDLIGSAAFPVVIGAVTNPAATATKNLSIASVKIMGSLTDAIIRVGAASDLPERPDGQIGKVFIGGDFVRSSILASVKDVHGDGFGNADDTRNTLVNESIKLVSSIASVIIKGAVSGPGSSYSGIEAELIGSVKIGTTTLALKKGPSNDFVIHINTDIDSNAVVNELAQPA